MKRLLLRDIITSEEIKEARKVNVRIGKGDLETFSLAEYPEIGDFVKRILSEIGSKAYEPTFVESTEKVEFRESHLIHESGNGVMICISRDRELVKTETEMKAIKNSGFFEVVTRHFSDGTTETTEYSCD